MKVTMVQGEIRPLTFSITVNGRPKADLDKDDLTLIIKHQVDESPLIVKHPDDFDMLYSSMGLATVNFLAGDLDLPPDVYHGQIRVVNQSGKVRKTELFDFEVTPALDVARLLGTVVGASSATSEVELTIQ